MCLTLQPHGLQHARLLCPPLSSGVCSNLCQLNWWCHLTISSSATRFALCLQSFPASGSFPVSRFFTSGGQSIGASASVLPMNIQNWLPLELTGLISWQSKALSRVFSSTTIWKHPFFGSQPSLWSNSHVCAWLLEKCSFYYMDLCHQSDVSALNMLSMSVITFLPRSKHLLISWQQSQSTVILEPKKRISVTVPTFSPLICHDVMGLDAVILVLWMLSFKPGFSFSSFTLIKRLFSSSSVSAIRVVSSPYESQIQPSN